MTLVSLVSKNTWSTTTTSTAVLIVSKLECDPLCMAMPSCEDVQVIHIYTYNDVMCMCV